MKGKGILVKVFVLFILVLVFFGIHLLIGNPLFSSFSALYTIDQARIENRMLSDGMVEVHETITYRMQKPFRGVFREIPPSRYVTIENVEIWTEGVETQHIEWEYQNERGFSARAWLVPFRSTFRLDPRRHPEVVLHVRYRARYVFENGLDVAQVFRQFWGNWDSRATNVEGIFEFPENVTIDKVYTHPTLPVTQEGNRFTVLARHLPPKAIAEVRFVIQPAENMSYAAWNPTLTLSAIEEEEKAYRKEVQGGLLLLSGILGVFVFLWILIYLLLGREPEVGYGGLYEWEPPYDDPPDIVNAIVKRIGTSCDNDGIAAVLLHLYHLDLVDFPEKEKGKAVFLKREEVPHDLPSTEKTFFALLKKFSLSRVFHFERLQEDLEKSTSRAQEFNKALSSYHKEVFREVSRRRYFYSVGNIIAKILAFLAMLSAIGIAQSSTSLFLAHFSPFVTAISGALFFGGGGILLARRDLFGRFSKEGRKYYLRWQNFARCITDYSLLSERPPQSVVLWEKYLIYATALGLGETVSHHLQRMVPKEVVEEKSPHPFFFSPHVFLPGRNFTNLSTQAMATVARSSSGGGGKFGGGFGGGAGGFGGGSGGGRGGAF